LSEIRATTISDAAGTGPATLTGQYAAKAWVNFNGNSGAVIRDSENVSSTTDNATGNYTVSFTNSLSDTNYCANVSIARGATTTGAGSVSVFATSSAGVKASAALGAYGESLNSATFGDAQFICSSFVGDLA